MAPKDEESVPADEIEIQSADSETALTVDEENPQDEKTLIQDDAKVEGDSDNSEGSEPQDTIWDESAPVEDEAPQDPGHDSLHSTLIRLPVATGQGWDSNESMYTDLDWNEPPYKGVELERISPWDLQAVIRQTRIVEDPWEVPFLIQHYFLNYLRVILEEAMNGFIKLHCSSRLTECELSGASLEIAKSVGVLKSELFATPPVIDRGMTIPVDVVLNYCEVIRNDAVHRSEKVSMLQLERAMLMPGILRDDDRAMALGALWQKVRPSSQDTLTAEQEVRRAFSAIAAPAEVPKMNSNQLMYRVMTTLERALFAYATEHDPSFLTENKLTFSEQIEVPRWRRDWAAIFHAHDRELLNLTADAQELRNSWAHHENIPTYKLMSHLRQAILLTLRLKDHAAALEIEALTEQWRKGCSRAAVLHRLQVAYQQDTVTTFYPEQLLAGRKRAIEGLLQAEDIAETSDRDVGILDDQARSWPLSMHTAVKCYPDWREDRQLV